MAKKKNGVVPLRLVVQRINGKLAATGQILIKATLWMRMKPDYGDYYILDLNGKVMDTHRPGETGSQVACVEGSGRSGAQVEKTWAESPAVATSGLIRRQR